MFVIGFMFVIYFWAWSLQLNVVYTSSETPLERIDMSLIIKPNKNWKRRAFPIFLYEASSTLILKPGKDTHTQRKLQANSPDKHRSKKS